MSRFLSAVIMTLLVLLPAPVVACAMPSAGLEQSTEDKEKLQKALENTQKKLDRERKKVEKTLLPKVRANWDKASDEATAKTIIAGIERVTKEFAADIAKAQKAKSEKSRDARMKKANKALAEVIDGAIGPRYGAWLAPTVGSYIVQSEIGADGSIDAEGVWEATKTDCLEFSSFEEAYEKVLSRQMFATLSRLQREKASLQLQLKKVEEALAAAEAGLPFGMVRVPAGSHHIGIDKKDVKDLNKMLRYTRDPASTLNAYRSFPAKQVALAEFYMDRHEVTCTWWASFLEDLAKSAADDDESWRSFIPKRWIDKESEKGWKIPSGYANRPVTGISLEQAQQFAAWIGRRIPSEFEWEAAARFDSDRKTKRFWAWGDKWLQDESPANISVSFNHPERRTLGIGMPQVISVGAYQNGSNGLGLYDMTGNAVEWTTSPFKPYPGFPKKGFVINKERLTFADFTEAYVAIRGGDALKRDIVSTTFWRRGVSPTVKADYIGFRTASSAVRGMDAVAWAQDRPRQPKRLQRYLVATDPLAADDNAGRKYGTLCFDDPDGYTAMLTGGYDAETERPVRARQILVIRREVDGFRNIEDLRAQAADAPVMLGYLRLDHATTSPPLEAGEYLVSWRNTFIPEPEPGEEVDPKNKPQPIPDALLFKQIETTEVKEAVAFADFLPPTVSKGSRKTRISVQPDQNVAEVILSFPTSKYDKNNAFSVTFKLTFAEEGIAAQLK